MKKRIRLLGLIAIMTSIFYVGDVSAEESKKIFLLEETFDDYGDSAQIYRYYQIEGSTETIPYGIDVPEVIYDKIKDSDNPLLETKKEMTVAYRYLKLEKRLAELNGVYLDRHPNSEIAIGDKLKKEFDAELDVLNDYADNELRLINKMSKKAQEKLYVVDSLTFVDYGKEEEFYKKTDSNYEEMKEAATLYEEDVKESSIKKATIDDAKKDIPYGLYIGVGFILIFIVSLTVIVFKKRR